MSLFYSSSLDGCSVSFVEPIGWLAFCSQSVFYCDWLLSLNGPVFFSHLKMIIMYLKQQHLLICDLTLWRPLMIEGTIKRPFGSDFNTSHGSRQLFMQ